MNRVLSAFISTELCMSDGRIGTLFGEWSARLGITEPSVISEAGNTTYS